MENPIDLESIYKHLEGKAMNYRYQMNAQRSTNWTEVGYIGGKANV